MAIVVGLEGFEFPSPLFNSDLLDEYGQRKKGKIDNSVVKRDTDHGEECLRERGGGVGKADVSKDVEKVQFWTVSPIANQRDTGRPYVRYVHYFHILLSSNVHLANWRDFSWISLPEALIWM